MFTSGETNSCLVVCSPVAGRISLVAFILISILSSSERGGAVTPPRSLLAYVHVDVLRFCFFRFRKRNCQDTVLILGFDFVASDRRGQCDCPLEPAKESFRPIDLGFGVFLLVLAFTGNAE